VISLFNFPIFSTGEDPTSLVQARVFSVPFPSVVVFCSALGEEKWLSIFPCHSPGACLQWRPSHGLIALSPFRCLPNVSIAPPLRLPFPPSLAYNRSGFLASDKLTAILFLILPPSLDSQRGFLNSPPLFLFIFFCLGRFLVVAEVLLSHCLPHAACPYYPLDSCDSSLAPLFPRGVFVFSPGVQRLPFLSFTRRRWIVPLI